ncbi:MAG: PfkB family carbohydrate kinase [Phycisphaerales bacterium]
MIQRNRFVEYVDRFQRVRALVVGPATVEIDIACSVTRLAPDRAMPVYLVERESAHPGGAALTATTLSNLGAEATLLAPVGVGAPGAALRDALASSRVELVEVSTATRTPELLRYLGGAQQLMQMRRGWQSGAFDQLDSTLNELSRRATDDGPPFDVICIVDGQPQALTAGDVEAIRGFADRWSIPVVLDEAGGFTNWAAGRMDYLVVNDNESQRIGRRLGAFAEDPVDRVRLLSERVAPNVLISLGRRGGVSGVRNDGEVEITPVSTPAHAMSDRRGVGYVLSGVYALAIGAGANADEAAFLACHAASAAAAAPGPKQIGRDELLKIAYREIESQVADGIEVFGRIARDHLPVIDQAARLLMQAYTDDRQVLVFGNGGSAAEANHLVTELTGRFRRNRASLPCISLSSNDALATCIANDYGFEDVFARQIEAFCRPGDVVIGMSTSGRSTNVIRAMERAREREARIIAFTGEQSGPMHDLADLVLAVPSRSTPRIQEAHLFTIHVMCEMLDRRVNAEGQLHPSATEI